jgi:hypothetical protein
MPSILKRVESVRTHRLESKRATTKELAGYPTLFGEIRQPKIRYLLIPRTSSERREYIPIGFIAPKVVSSDACLLLPEAKLYHFGVLTSSMHMAWVRHVCGRLKSDYRYSAKLVYNNFPWPESLTREQKKAVENAAQAVLSARDDYPEASLAILYNPLTMPPSLLKAHVYLDRAIDRCYRSQPFSSERQRVEFLFDIYEKIVTPLAPSTPSGMKRTPRRARKTGHGRDDRRQLHLFFDGELN